MFIHYLFWHFSPFNEWFFNILVCFHIFYICFDIDFLTGGNLAIDDHDPLPNEDVNDEHSSHDLHPVNSEFITISVSNDQGEKIKGQLQNG